MRKIKYIFYYGIYLILVLGLIDYFIYRAYINKIDRVSFHSAKNRVLSLYMNESQSVVKHVDALTLFRLGSINTDKKSSFVNFAEKKNQNIIRIGCFGGSFTYGDEVNEVYDYPSILQNIFINAGYKNFEVINFGSLWYGFSQSFMMWKYVGSKYDLDYVLFGPVVFKYIEYETAFNHTINTGGINIDYMHARFILDGEKFKLVDVYGQTHKSRAENYFRFIPLLRYLRFDNNTPSFLACLIPSGRQLQKNPFYYYRGNLRNEVKAIHKLLLFEMLTSVKNLKFAYYPFDAVGFARDLKKENLSLDFLYRIRKFPYTMIGRHNSPCGNQLVAQQLFDLIVGKKISRWPILETNDLKAYGPAESGIKKYKLHEYKDIKIEINDIVIGYFMNAYPQYFIPTTPFDITQNKIMSLLAFKKEGISILDAFFVPLDFSLTGNSSVKILISWGKQKEEHFLGNVQLLNPSLEVGLVNLRDIYYDNGKSSMFCRVQTELLRAGAVLGKKPEITIFLDNKPILKAIGINYKNGVIEFLPIKYNFMAIKPKGDSFIDINKLNERGIIYLALYYHDGKKINIPFAEWRKR